jgi:hypothetical protein
MTKRKIEIGGSNFEEYVTKNTLLVDKTLLVQDILEGGNKVLLITRPRRWGKTLNMSMLNYFFSIPTTNEGAIDEKKRQQKVDAFSKMNVSAYPEMIKEYCGQYPVIFVSFKDIKKTAYEEIKDDIRNLLYKLYKTHSYLSQSSQLNETDKILFQKFIAMDFNDAQLRDSLLYLSEMLYKHFGKKAIILIDEYDTPLNDWYANALSKENVDGGTDQLAQQILSLFRNIFGAALKDNDYLERAVVTGILRIAKASLFSGLNNLGEDSILDHRYAKHFGFTETEIKQLLFDAEIKHDDISLENLKSWYNGYNIGGLTLYNPWSVMNYLNSNGDLAPYWIGTASIDLIENVLVSDTFQEDVQKLIADEEVEAIADPKMVFSDIKSSPDALYNFLLFSGYLTTKSAQRNADSTYKCSVKIPNNEVRGVFTGFIQKWLSRKFNIRTVEYDAFVNKLLKGEVESFVEQLRNYLAMSASYYGTGPKNRERFYNGFVMGLISNISSHYSVESEKESGEGRVDIMITPKSISPYKNAIIIEFKSVKNNDSLKTEAVRALEQINTKKYDTKIQAYEEIEKTIKLGLAFCGKDVEAVYKINDRTLS